MIKAVINSNNNDSYSYDDNLVQYHYRNTGIIELLLTSIYYR